MRVLWLAPEPPVAPLTGGRERARQMLTYLSARHRVHLLTLAERADRAALQALAPSLDGLTIVPFQSRPQDNRGALRAGLERVLARQRPDVVHVQGLDAWPGPSQVAGYVLDLHDIPSVLEERLQSLHRQRRRLPTLLRRWGTLGAFRRTERQALQRARAVIVTCQADAQALAQHDLPLPPITVLANGVDLDYWHGPAGEPDRPTILFPGALNWPPNIDAAKTLVSQVLPVLLRRLPEARVVLAGRRPHRDLVRLARAHAAVSLLPDPADMRPVFARATVAAVPLRAATGTRLKILQALALGRPVVSTPQGAAGLALTPGRHLLVEPLVEPFAAAIVRLVSDPALRRRLVVAGSEAIVDYAWPRVLPTLDAVYPERSGDQ